MMRLFSGALLAAAMVQAEPVNTSRRQLQATCSDLNAGAYMYNAPPFLSNPMPPGFPVSPGHCGQPCHSRRTARPPRRRPSSGGGDRGNGQSRSRSGLAALGIATPAASTLL